MRRFTKPVVLVAALSALMLVLAACGGGGGGQDSGSSGSGGDGVLVVEMGPGFAFNPNTINVKAGQEVKIQLVNKDSTVHDFVVDALGVKSDAVSGGQTVELTFTPSEPGEYEFICSVPGHAAGGMVGTLVVSE